MHDDVVTQLPHASVVERYFELCRKAERKGLHVRASNGTFVVSAGKGGPPIFEGDNVTALLRRVKAFRWQGRDV
jgi:hypothetical protein